MDPPVPLRGVLLRSVRPGVPCADPPEGLDEVPADFLPQSGGPFGALLKWLARLIERHHLKPVAEGAADGLERVQTGSGAATQVADRIGVAGGKYRDAAVGDAGAIDEVEEPLSEVPVRISSTHAAHKDVGLPGIFSPNSFCVLMVTALLCAHGTKRRQDGVTTFGNRALQGSYSLAGR